MKFSKWIVTMALCMSAKMASVQAEGVPYQPCYNNPCDICELDVCETDYTFFIDALYWGVCKSDLQVDIVKGQAKYIDPNHHWGYRLGGFVRWKCWDLGLRYTAFCSNDKFKKKSTFTFDYNVFDIETGYNCCLPNCSLAFRPFFGVKIARLKDRLTSDGIYREFVKAKIDFRGCGLYIGAATRWELLNFALCDTDFPVALVARASTAIMRGTLEQRNKPGLYFENGHHCNTVPVHELYAGLDFSCCNLCGVDAFFQVGYEAQFWGWREYASVENVAHLGLDGLVLRFGASF